MHHLFFEVLFPVFCALVLLPTAFVLGFSVVKRLRLPDVTFLLQLSVSVLIGYGLLSYIALILSLITPLHKSLLWGMIILIFLLGRSYLKIFSKELSLIWESYKKNYARNKLVWVLGFLFLFYLTSAFVPPYRVDALSYHLPEALQIARQGVFSIGGLGDFSGNLPVLMETLYAFLYTLSGFVLINLVHYQILLCALVAIFCVCKSQYGKRAALIGLIGIFSIYDLFVNATNAYVDAATVAFEIGGVLAFFLWTKQRDRAFLLLTGILYGLAISCKYLPLYSLVILFLFFAYFEIVQNKNRSIKDVCLSLICLCLPIAVFGGFWYIKNLIVLGNPMYPFIFGHQGFTNEDLQFKTLMVKDFYAGSVFTWSGLKDFLLVPFNKFLTPYYLFVFLAFFSLPAWWWLKKKQSFITYLFCFFFAFLSMWFFFISHQTRFGLVGWVVLMIFAGIVLAEFLQKYGQRLNRPVCMVLLVVLGLCGLWAVATHKNNYFLHIKKTEFAYLLGVYNDSEFYNNRGMGDIFALSQFINSEYHDINVLNNWSGFNLLLTRDNTYINLTSDAKKLSTQDWSVVCTYLAARKIGLIEIDGQAVQRSSDTSTMDNRENAGLYVLVKKFEAMIIQHSELIFERNEGRLYRISDGCGSG